MRYEKMNESRKANKKCCKCGCEIVYGVNGCMIMDDCFTCHGGYPKYPEPVRICYPESIEYLDYTEDRCLSMGCMPD